MIQNIETKELFKIKRVAGSIIVFSLNTPLKTSFNTLVDTGICNLENNNYNLITLF